MQVDSKHGSGSHPTAASSSWIWEPKWGSAKSSARFPTKTNHLQHSWRESSNQTLKLQLCFLGWSGPYILDDEIHLTSSRIRSWLQTAYFNYITWQRSPTAAVWVILYAHGWWNPFTLSLEITQMIQPSSPTGHFESDSSGGTTMMAWCGAPSSCHGVVPRKTT